jgi:hypothetical protein
MNVLADFTYMLDESETEAKKARKRKQISNQITAKKKKK